MNGLDTWRARRELLENLVSRELKGRYKGSALGYLWNFFTPLFMGLIYLFFLRLLAGRAAPMESILLGVFAWQFTAQSVQGGLVSITGNSNLVRKVAFPRAILPVASTAANLVSYLLSLVVQFALLLVIVLPKGGGLSGWTAALPLIIAWQAVFNLSLALWLSVANVYFRDTQHIVGLLLSAWFFVSPVMYDLTFLGGFATGEWAWVKDAYLLNPMAGLLTLYRAAVLPGVAFPWTPWSVAGLALPALLLAGGWLVFRKAQRNVADLL